MISAILLSGGFGKRLSIDTPKQYLPLQGIPLILHSLKALLSFPSWHEIIIVCEEKYEPLFSEQSKKAPLRFARPGAERQDSVFSGLQKASCAKWICVHDGARPLLSSKDLFAVIEAGKLHGAAALAVPVKMTIKQVNSELFVKKTLDRSTLWELQTPQMIQYDLMMRGFQKVQKEKLLVTDDVSLAECLDHPVKLVHGSYSNIKITTPEDFALANLFMSRNAEL